MPTDITPSDLDDIIQLIPGYDPVATAGDCVFDAERALQPINFFADCLVHVKGQWANSPFLLEPWEQAIVANTFGWLKPNGMRRYRDVFVFVPRKNGKSILAAGICTYILFCDGEPGAEIYSAAAEKEQAKLVFDVAREMCLRSEDLGAVANVQMKVITIEEMMSSYRPISAEAYSKHGYNVHMAAIDELHAHPDRELVDVLDTATAARRQPLFVYLTTSDFEREGSICNEMHEHAKQVRDGLVEDQSFLPVVYEASVDDDWQSPEVWRAANPNMDVSVPEEYLAKQCAKAIRSPQFENTFKRLHLNIRTFADVKWLDVARWDECAAEFGAEDLIGERCYAGLDLGSTADLCAFVMIFPGETPIDEDGNEDTEGAIWTIIPRFWCPEAAIEKRSHRDASNRVIYDEWERAGLLIATPGDVCDYDVIREDILGLSEQHQIEEVAINRWNSTQLQTQLDAAGLEIVQFGQGYASMSAPSKEFERRILARTVRHDGNRVMRWMVANAVVQQDHAANLKPDKKKSTDKIDGVVAAIMAVGRVLADEGGSVYDKRGVFTA